MSVLANIPIIIIEGALWDEEALVHLVLGSFGECIGKKMLTVVKFLGLK
jgi:hypothetical protein